MKIEMMLNLLDRIERIVPCVTVTLEEPSHFPIEGNADYGEIHIGNARANAKLLYQLGREARELAKGLEDG